MSMVTLLGIAAYAVMCTGLAWGAATVTRRVLSRDEMPERPLLAWEMAHDMAEYAAKEAVALGPSRDVAERQRYPGLDYAMYGGSESQSQRNALMAQVGDQYGMQQDLRAQQFANAFNQQAGLRNDPYLNSARFGWDLLNRHMGR